MLLTLLLTIRMNFWYSMYQTYLADLKLLFGIYHLISRELLDKSNHPCQIIGDICSVMMLWVCNSCIPEFRISINLSCAVLRLSLSFHDSHIAFVANFFI